MFTLGNLLCGFLAIANTIEGSKSTLIHAAWWIIIAALFDTLDGKIARLTGTASAFGIEFDSLADVVSFGVAPAVLFHSYVFTDAGNFGYFLAFCFLAAGTIRLARFNLTASTGKKGYFTGMPIPATAGVLASFILFSENVWVGFVNFDFCVALIMLLSIVMVSNFKYNALPRISFTTKGDTVRSIFYFACFGLIVSFPDEFFFPLGVLYLFSGPVRYFTAPAFEHVFHKVHHR